MDFYTLESVGSSRIMETPRFLNIFIISLVERKAWGAPKLLKTHGFLDIFIISLVEWRTAVESFLHCLQAFPLRACRPEPLPPTPESVQAAIWDQPLCPHLAAVRRTPFHSRGDAGFVDVCCNHKRTAQVPHRFTKNNPHRFSAQVTAQVR